MDLLGSDLPPRVDAVVRGAHVVTMDPRLGDLPGADVRIRDGAIVAVGYGLTGGDTIDATGMTLLPGLVETHWHLWNTLLRGLVDKDAGLD